MKFSLILLFSTVGGVLSGDHFQSFMAGFGISALAIGTAYWIAFRVTRYPQLALLLLLLAMVSKLIVTVIGVMWALNANVISSPFVFALSYLFFSIVVSYGYFKLRERQLVVMSQSNSMNVTSKKSSTSLIN